MMDSLSISQWGIPIPAKPWDYEKLTDQDEILISSDTFRIIYCRGQRVNDDITVEYSNIVNGGFTKRHIVEMISTTVERLRREGKIIRGDILLYRLDHCYDNVYKMDITEAPFCVALDEASHLTKQAY